MVGRRCAMAGQDTPPHRTAPIRCCFFQFDCFSGEMEIIEHLSLSHRALAQRTRSNPSAITSPRPRLLLELTSSTAALQAPASEEYIRSNRVRRRRRCGSRPPLVPSPVRKLYLGIGPARPGTARSRASTARWLSGQGGTPCPAGRASSACGPGLRPRHGPVGHFS